MRNNEYEAEISSYKLSWSQAPGWVKVTNARIAIILKDATLLEGGMIKRIVERVSPRIFVVVAFLADREAEDAAPCQRYVEQLPLEVKFVIFDGAGITAPVSC